MHSLLCWYCMRLGCLYYVIWTFHVLSLYIMFLSHLLFLCVAVYLSTSRLSSLTISSLFSYTNYVFNNEREKERLKYMSTTYTVKSCLVFFPHTYAHPINTTNCGVRYTHHIREHYMCAKLNIYIQYYSILIGFLKLACFLQSHRIH